MITTIEQLDINGTYSYSDYLTWKFKERVELIKGKLFKMSPAPSSAHQEVSANLLRPLLNFFYKTPCKVYSAPFDVRLPVSKGDKPHTVVQPDVCVICDSSKIDKKGCAGAPDLVVEILSPGNSSKEMREKFEVYEESGVKEYWMVYPVEKSVQVFVLGDDGKYYGLKPFIEGDLMDSRVFTDLEVDLGEVFEGIDKLL